ncbi:DUF4157 domain-containing protein [Fluviicola chungangensis]|nr:DUF4157 domain-containing protein [Fluviicola chungangensis]
MKTRAQSQNRSADASVRAKAKNQATNRVILQAYKQGTSQLAAVESESVQRKENKTGLPDNLKSGVENISGYSLDDVKVHYNSSEPASLQAQAYAQGTDIHVAPGQEKHLPHEAWHVVQQKQGRVKPTKQLKDSTNINDDAGLEKEADTMGLKALQMKSSNETCCPKNGETPKSTYQLAKGTKVTQLETKIGYGNLQDFEFKGKKGKVGSYMKAELDPNDAKTGSDTGGSNAYSGLFNHLQSKTASTWVRGHLLNHDLGGVAHYNNLFPITTAANNEHKYEVEYPVKHWLENDCEITYEVTAEKTGNDQDGDGVFKCDAYVTKGATKYQNQRVQKNIYSKTTKVSSDKEYRKKGKVKRNGFVEVTIGSNNTILRDDYKTHGVRNGWQHTGGNTGNNHFFHSTTEGFGKYSGDELNNLQDIDDIDQEVQLEWLEFLNDYKVIGGKVDGDLVNDIYEEAVSEAESLEDFTRIIIEELKDAGYTVQKK